MEGRSCSDDFHSDDATLRRNVGDNSARVSKAIALVSAPVTDTPGSGTARRVGSVLEKKADEKLLFSASSGWREREECSPSRKTQKVYALGIESRR